MFILTGICLALGMVVALLSLGILLLSRKPPLIFGKYPCKGLFYSLKFGIALLVLRRLRYRIYRRNEEVLGSAEHLASMDRPQPLTNDPKSYDVVSFMAANAEGQKLMVSLERRRRGVLKAALYLWLPGEGLYSLPKLPDMAYFTTDGSSESKEFQGHGFHIYPEKSMHIWRLKFKGSLRKQQTEQLVEVEMDLSFDSSVAHFDYNRDLSSSLIADSVAREAWNDRFYGMLKSVGHILEQRKHYEQTGDLTGSLLMEGKRPLRLKLRGSRDHSFGTERCLSSINRYVYFALFLDDGSSLVVGNLSQPSFFLSSLKVGYVFTPEGKYQPITSTNFELYSYGEKGVPPQHQNFIINTADGSYLVQIRVEETALRYVGGDWESKVYNQFVSCTVNGIKGQGHAEYLYRHEGGRPETVSRQDPLWYQSIKRFERSLSNMEQTGNEEDFIF